MLAVPMMSVVGAVGAEKSSSSVPRRTVVAPVYRFVPASVSVLSHPDLIKAPVPSMLPEIVVSAPLATTNVARLLRPPALPRRPGNTPFRDQ